MADGGGAAAVELSRAVIPNSGGGSDGTCNQQAANGAGPSDSTGLSTPAEREEGLGPFASLTSGEAPLHSKDSGSQQTVRECIVAGTSETAGTPRRSAAVTSESGASGGSSAHTARTRTN